MSTYLLYHQTGIFPTKVRIIIQHIKNIPNYYGLTIAHECNPMQPRYARGEAISFKLTNEVTDYDCDYLIKRKAHDAEIVRIFEYQEPPFIVEHDKYDDRELIYYVMIPVYNE